MQEATGQWSNSSRVFIGASASFAWGSFVDCSLPPNASREPGSIVGDAPLEDLDAVADPGMPAHPLMKAMRSSFTLSLRVVHRPCGAPL